MLASKRQLCVSIAIFALGGCAEKAEQAKVVEKPTSDAFVEFADQRVKLIALRSPQWSKPELTYALSVCWRFASGMNIKYGRGTCALVMEELELPTYSIDFATKNPMASCYTAGQSALMRMQEIAKAIDGGKTALDAIAGHNTDNPQEVTFINEDFADCKRAIPGLKRDAELKPVKDYATQASKLMPGRRKREAMEELSTTSSLIWPDERVEEKARVETATADVDAKMKADAQSAIAELNK